MAELGIKTVIKQICAEKNLDEDAVVETINSALAAAYRKDFGEKNQNIQADFNLDTGEIKVFDVKTVVEDLTEEELAAIEKLKQEREDLREALEKGAITPQEYKEKQEEQKAEADQKEAESEEEIRKFNPRTEIQISEAKKINKKYELEDEVKTELDIPGEFGRMAAQTAKQVIIQRLREAERNVIYQQFKEREGEILIGIVQKIEGRNVIIDIEKAAAVLPPQEQIRNERYRIGDKVKVYLLGVNMTTRGPEIIVSRAHPEIVKQLFTLEIPEIQNDIIEIQGIAREAGSRTKIAVHTDDESIDPIGSCIGQRGARIQTIIQELNGEKIDIIEYDEDPVKYIINSLLPAKITSVEINEEDKTASVTVPQDQLSLTIGRGGQNVRLASKITGWKLSIKEQETGKEISEDEISGDKSTKNKEEQETSTTMEQKNDTDSDKSETADKESEQKEDANKKPESEDKPEEKPAKPEAKKDEKK